MIDLRRKLTHVAQLETRVSSSGGGLFPNETDVSSTNTINCYCYYESGERKVGPPNVLTSIGKWTVILPRSLWPIPDGSVLRNIVDRFGQQIVAKGRIEERTIYTHYRDGTSFVQIVLNPNVE